MQDRSSSSAQLKLQALQFVREALSAEGAAAWRTHLAALAPPIAAAASERYYKVGSEALRARSVVCRVIRPDASAPVPSDLQVRPSDRAHIALCKPELHAMLSGVNHPVKATLRRCSSNII